MYCTRGPARLPGCSVGESTDSRELESRPEMQGALAGGRRARTRRGECFAPSARPPTESLTPEAGWRRVPSGTTRVRPCCCSLWPARARRLVPSGLPPCPLRRSRQEGCHCEYAECPDWSLPAGGPPPSALGRASFLRRASRLRRAANTRLPTSLVTSHQVKRARPRPRLCDTDGASRTSP